MGHISAENHHDAVNLHRLLRRLEKSAQTPSEWTPLDHSGMATRSESTSYTRSGGTTGNAKARIQLKAQKDLQKVKYARKLVKGLGESSAESNLDSPEGSGYSYGPGAYRGEGDEDLGYTSFGNNGGRARENDERTRIHELNEVQIRLDRVEAFLREQIQKHAQPPRKPPSLLSQIPTPQYTPTISSSSLLQEGEASRAPGTGEGPAVLPKQAAEDNLLLSPPDLTGLPSAGLLSSIPHDIPEPSGSPPPYQPSLSFTPSRTAVASSSAFSTARPSTGLLSRKPQPSRPTTKTHTLAQTSLQEELSAQLESMAAQLKRNAMHFATSLANDKAVVAEAAEKIERNFDVLQVEKGRLGALGKRAGKTTWMTLGVIVAVLIVFMAMVGLIRFSRF